MRSTYIAFLRAVNVGGRVVKMQRLRALFEELGLTDVRTFLQSGNVAFTTGRTDRTRLTKGIERHLARALGYDVPVMVRTIAEVDAALGVDPFKDIEVTPDVRFFVLFLSEPLPADLKLPLHAPKQGFSILDCTRGEAFVVMRLLGGRPGNPAAFLEKTFGVSATSRFFHTLAKILAAAKSST